MKILMTTDTLGGVWTYALELIDGLAPLGAEVALATLGRPLSDDQRAELALLKNVEVFESGYRLEWMQDPWEDVEASGDWLLELADKTGADLVHLNGYAHAALDWPAPTLVAGHSCVLSWHDQVHRAPAGREWDCYREKTQAGLQAADLVVAPTQAMLDQLDCFYGPLGERQVILNGRAPARFYDVVKEPWIMAAGRLWDEAKNIEALARVAPRLSWPVRVAGDARHPDGGENELAGVELLGRLSAEQMTGHYARAAIYALPARYEPFGLSALEAALSGCALVLGDIPSLREVWGDAAWLVPPDAPDKLIHAVNMLIGHQMLREQYVRRSRRRAVALTSERMARRYHQAYRRLLAGRGGGGSRQTSGRGGAVGDQRSVVSDPLFAER